LRDRTVLLVGATQGLGLALAERYLREDWRLVATTLMPSAQLDALVARHPGRSAIHQLDITDADAAGALGQALGDDRIDVLHIVAGILPADDKPIWDYSDAERLRVLDTNAIGAVRLAHIVAPLVPAGGVFAFTSSGMGSMTRNTRGSTDLYRVSKAALNMLVRSFAATHGTDRAVLLICPGWAKTEMGGPLATVEVSDSVDGIYRLVDGAAPGTDGAIFRDYSGETLPW
jgi:NAD(P)-dependent dehydrogenase (short-subunit alcohol dehydrogenase family)